MTRINWTEVHELKRLDEIIAYAIITLQEAYTAPYNYDLDIETKKDVSQWVRWEIAYDEKGRAFFRYAATLYVVDKHPLGDRDFMELIIAPTRWLVNHASVGLDPRIDDTSLAIDTLTDIPPVVVTMEQLLFWAIVLGDWWNQTLRYLTYYVDFDAVPLTPIGNWGAIQISPGDAVLVGEVTGGTIDEQFDAYNGTIDNLAIPDFLQNLLDKPSDGTGSITQQIDLPARDSGVYRENLVTCEEQDPAIKNYSQQQLDTLLPTK
jgi:hypothetical protein